MRWRNTDKHIWLVACIVLATSAVLYGAIRISGLCSHEKRQQKQYYADADSAISRQAIAHEAVDNKNEDPLRHGLNTFVELAQKQGVTLEPDWEKEQGFIAHLYCVDPWKIKGRNVDFEPIHPLTPAAPKESNQWHVVQVDIDNFRKLRDMGIPVKVDPEMSRAYLMPALPAKDTPMEVTTMGTGDQTDYRSIETLLSDLRQMATNYPSISELVDFGDSYNKTAGLGGYDLLALKVTNQSITNSKPVFFMISMMHGNEVACGETAMMYLDWLLSNYGQNADATWIVDHHEIWVAPAVNPDGRRVRVRQNARGVDLNRNFTFKWGGGRKQFQS